ncbi:MAG: hypothetical protein V3S89_00540 [Desulfobacterales bacterium]
MKPPSTIRIRIVEAGKKILSIWLPFFVVWPLAGVLIIAMKVTGKWTVTSEAAPVLIEVLCALKGLAVRVENRQKRTSVVVVFH